MTKLSLQVDHVDEILEGYRTFTALAAEVGAPGGSGIMASCGLNDATRVAKVNGTPNPSRTGTLEDYAPLQRQQQYQQQQQAGSKLAIARKGKGRPSVPYFDPASDPVVMDALRLLFAKEGNYVQDLVSEDQAAQIWCNQEIVPSASQCHQNYGRLGTSCRDNVVSGETFGLVE